MSTSHLWQVPIEEYILGEIASIACKTYGGSTEYPALNVAMQVECRGETTPDN